VDIYRKPTYTDTTINFLSNHPIEQKTAAFRFHITRMHSLPLDPDKKQKEWKTIQTIPKNCRSALNRCTVQPFTESDDTRCCVNAIFPPEDGHVNARNMSRIIV
jgi:hypothetical protein